MKNFKVQIHILNNYPSAISEDEIERKRSKTSFLSNRVGHQVPPLQEYRSPGSQARKHHDSRRWLPKIN